MSANFTVSPSKSLATERSSSDNGKADPLSVFQVSKYGARSKLGREHFLV